MSPRRGDRAAPPPVGTEYDIRFANTGAAQGWDDLSRQAAGNLRRAYGRIRAAPRARDDPDRQHRLKGSLGSGVFTGQSLERWQLDVTGCGRTCLTTTTPPYGSPTPARDTPRPPSEQARAGAKTCRGKRADIAAGRRPGCRVPGEDTRTAAWVMSTRRGLSDIRRNGSAGGTTAAFTASDPCTARRCPGDRIPPRRRGTGRHRADPCASRAVTVARGGRRDEVQDRRGVGGGGGRAGSRWSGRRSGRRSRCGRG